MSEMVERVARAIMKVCVPQLMRGWSEMTDQQRSNEIDGGWDMWEDEARAAIEAMREPTEAMVTKGRELIRGNLRPDEIYPSMIDEALKD